MNRLLDRKLGRDLRTHLGSLVAIAIVIACGESAFVAMRSVARMLTAAQVNYYRQVRFPDVFAHVRRAPDAVLPVLRAIPGIARLEARAIGDVVLRVPGLREPAAGRIVGTRPPDAGTLNHLVLRHGRRPLPDEADAAVLSEGFANANGITVGDTVNAILGDRWQTLRIVGVGVTAEFVYEIRPGDMLPDTRRYGVVWLDAGTAAEAFGLDGAWNDLAATLVPGVNADVVIAALDAALERYGSLGAYGRAHHASHRFVSEEIRQNRTFAYVLPLIFLGVAAFLIHLVLGRIVAQQRDQIGTMKAFGVPSVALARHYVLFALAPVLGGTAMGGFIGVRLAGSLAMLYADNFRFPELRIRISPADMSVAMLIAVVAATIGALGALRRLLSIPAAEAMRPEPPATYAHGRIDRALHGVRSPVTRMIVRSLAHRPWRTGLGAMGIGLGAAVVVSGTFGFDAVGAMRRIMFSIGLRADVTVVFAGAQGGRVLTALAALPGVLHVEPVREVAVRIRHGHRSRLTALAGVDPTARLRRVVDLRARVVTVPRSGIMLSASLARPLGADIADTVDLEFLYGRARRVSLPVTGIVNDISGAGAYVRADRLPSLVGVEELITGADLAVDAAALDSAYDRLARAPHVRAVLVRTAGRRAFDETVRRNFTVVLATLVAFATALAAGTVYNAGRVTISERARDLASLRVLGFTRREVARILFGELSVLAALGVPVGLLVGTGFAAATVAAFGSTEMFRLPLVIGPRTITAGIVVPLLSALAVARPLRRRLDRLDLVGVLKTRE